MPPFVTMAVLCRRLSKDEEGLEVIHGVADAITILDDPASGRAVRLLGAVKVMSDETGDYPFYAAVLSPAGVPASNEHRMSLALEAMELRRLALDFAIRLDAGEGRYWFVVEVGQESATRVPLEVRWAPDYRTAR